MSSCGTSRAAAISSARNGSGPGGRSTRRVWLPLCAHHAPGSCDDWTENNRLMCDLLHGGRIPPRLPPAEREEKFFDAEVVVEVA